MIPVYQRLDNDCLAACLASLLELPLGAVPNHPRAGARKQLERTQRWLRRLGYTLLEVPLRGSKAPWCAMAVPAWCVIAVQSRTTGDMHALVGRVDRQGLRVMHDPSKPAWARAAYRFHSVSFLVQAIT